ncbi:sensor domain-containing diguanylate cyclase [Shewanella sp. NIFS-20-20]|uniref:sensor domain-containing diguanylate cyclase n=1 Tax=Shewanella sp. NIFS-20-20 TaxID=2853806 RepID=UPI001C443AE6|nr:sensor domain-containing diguanylate cyclase [Shewanella sp. NIFS-20-20]MBV7316911.1 sensor domain-containing diguanylate cyclase [Shewanella sp. NIFS-20-20]
MKIPIIKYAKVNSQYKLAILLLLSFPLGFWLITANHDLAIFWYVAIYCTCTASAYALYRRQVKLQWRHIERVLKINQLTAEITLTSVDFTDETQFFETLLEQAIALIPNAHMGSIIKITGSNQACQFVCAQGMNLAQLQSIQFSLHQSFEYKLTQGRCDQVVTINDMESFNNNSGLSEAQKQAFLSSSPQPIRTTLSAPIYVNQNLYAMINLDSSSYGAFDKYDKNLVSILSREASHAITLFQQSRQIQALANTDSLTGLLNRQRFEALLVQHTQALLCIIDLDKLKQINDNQGHDAGDQILIAFSQYLHTAFTSSSLIARFGGDEFVVLFPNDEPQLSQALANLMQACGRHQPSIDFSIGISAFQGDFERSFKAADKAMYQQKRGKLAKVIPLNYLAS